MNDQKDEVKRPSLTGAITAVTAASFVASSLHVSGMAYALSKPLQRFMEPLDYVAISPGWVVGVLLSLLAAYGFENVTL